jgi:hypothetical protein
MRNANFLSSERKSMSIFGIGTGQTIFQSYDHDQAVEKIQANTPVPPIPQSKPEDNPAHGRSNQQSLQSNSSNLSGLGPNLL